MTTSEQVAHSPVRKGTWLFTWPPLMHFTTADLGNMADGKYDLERIVSRLRQLDATVLVTPQHLVEWIPLAEDSRERRFELMNHLQRATYVDLDSPSIWLRDGSPFTLTTIDAQGLRNAFYDAQGTPRAELVQWKEHNAGTGGAEFFARGARLLEGKKANTEEAFDESRLRKYHKANRKHGSDVSRLWSSGMMLGKLGESIAGVLGPVVPTKAKEPVKRAAARWRKLLASHEPRLHAYFEGVPVDNPGFHLWWHARKKLWANLRKLADSGTRFHLCHRTGSEQS